jgi:hypothetical protein
MALLGTIIFVVLLVAIRLLLPPTPHLVGLSQTFGKRTTVVLCSVAIAGAAVLIVLSKR